jgi:hypothetical protein
MSSDNIRKHVVITGTGRSGTTFLVELLTHLGFDTGFQADEIEDRISQKARAGLEHDIRHPGCPYVVKSPFFCDYAGEVLARIDVRIEHIFVPIRELHAAAESRRRVTRDGLAKAPLAARIRSLVKMPQLPGGLVHTHSMDAGKQEEALLRQIYNLLLATAATPVPVTLMQFPRIVNDCAYLYEKLSPLLTHIPYASFAESFNRVAQPGLVHDFKVQAATTTDRIQ